MQPATRGFLAHLAGYAVPHILVAFLLAVVAFTSFTPGGESASRSEAASLQLFVSAVLLGCSGAGYGCAIAVVTRQPATMRFSTAVGTMAGALTFAVAAIGGLSHLARELGVSVLLAAFFLGFAAGVGASFVVALTSRAFPGPRRI